ncbi:MAG: molybdate ABC transporter permease subunit [Nitrospiraceae bacterium]|nr:molybdate ABC transporter permease subunit [Nitrospiraceae bacterium]
MIHSALSITVALSLSTATILSLLALPLAGWIVFSGSRTSAVWEALLTLTLVLPPAVLGYLLLVAFSPESPPGAFLAKLLGHPLPFSFAGLLLGSLIYSLPFAVGPVAQSFRQVPKGTLEMARILGARPLTVFWKVVVPLSLPGIATGWILGFAHTVGEFGVVMMVGGNIPGETRTLSLKAYDDLLSADGRGGWEAIMPLLLFSFGALLALNLVRRRGASHAPNLPRS